ncbi:MAG TPA: CHRD domain-containing protein [Saprospiraceae bacterium]|nr:CHRD domain-containing protein [Saprospiraceae bacterium]
MRKYLHFFLLLFVLASSPLMAGQLSSNLVFTARLSGDQENPQVASDGQGVAVLTFDRTQTNVYINVSVSNLSSPITGAHIHEGAFGENGPVVLDLTSFLSGNRIKGVMRGLPNTVMSKLLSGDYYINVHTENNPGGEIRGQLALETDYRYTAMMNGEAENPAVTTNGRGLGIFALNQRETNVHFKILFTGLTSAFSAAHIHNAPAGTNGGVIFDLVPFVNGNVIEGDWQPDSAQLAELKAGNLYVNVHTADNPSGEIRGQITLLPGLTFDLSLTGDQENPPVTTQGQGLGIVTIPPTLDVLEYYIVYDQLSAPATASHFHQADPGVNGGVVLDISAGITDYEITGSSTFTVNAFNTLLEGGYYINIHTSTNPSGEIRGQIYKYAREGFVFELNGGQEVPSVTTQASGTGMVSVDRDETSAHYMVVYSGLEGDFTASHFHQAKPGVSGGVIYNITSSYNPFGGAFGYWDESSTPIFDAAPLMYNNEVYLNVHSSLHPSGEIRGNLVPVGRLFTELPFDPEFGDNLILAAVMSGDDEVPAVTTDARGLATLYFDGDLTQAKINITATKLSGPITGVHIHEGDVGTNGGVLFPLSNEGNRVQGDVTNIPGLDLVSIINGATYVNIHTAANPDGEIRGQLYLEQDFTFVANMNGAQEIPAVTTDGLGLASIHYTRGTLALEINAQLTGLSSTITGVHIHSGAPDANGPVIVDLSGLIDGNIIRGNIDVTLDNLIAIASGNAYINVHTTNNPDGEIRGQLNFIPGITFDGWMSPLQENPFTASAASGLAIATVYPTVNDIAVWMLTDNVTGPVGAAHLHNAPLTENGGVVHDLSADISGNGLVHLGSIDNSTFSALLTGDVYINAHTAAYPGGELRGQLFRLARDGYGFDLCSAQETGTVNAPGAQGSGMVSIDRLHSNIDIAVVADQLTGPLTQSHIHQGDIGANGGVIADLTNFYDGTTMFLFGAGTDTSLINAIRAGKDYINIHTDLHPAGEIRGQIVKEFLCTLEVGIDPIAEIAADVKLSPVPVIDQLQVNIDMLNNASLKLSVIDLTGRQLSTTKVDASAGENTYFIPVENLLPGFYSLMISDGNVAQAFKFVK